MTVVIDRKGPVSVADRARAKNEAPTGLYKPRVPIYPKNTRGPWRTIKWALLIATLAVYYVTPWIRFDRPGDLPDQAVLVDFEHGRFYFDPCNLHPGEALQVADAVEAALDRIRGKPVPDLNEMRAEAHRRLLVWRRNNNAHTLEVRPIQVSLNSPNTFRADQILRDHALVSKKQIRVAGHVSFR